MAQLAVVDADVAVDQFVRRRPVAGGVLDVVEHHVRVVEIVVRSLRKAIAVVPLAHQREGVVHIVAQRTRFPVRLQDLPHLGLGETQHLVEAPIQADVRPDVEAAGRVVHRDRRHAGDEQALDAAAGGTRLQRGEEAAVEAAAAGERPVGLGAAVRQHGVGEVVVLVDEHVERNALVARVDEELVELAVYGARFQDAPAHGFGKQVRVSLQGAAESRVAVGLEALPQRLQGVLEGGEVEAQNDVAIPVCRGPVADVRAFEERPEAFRTAPVVVVLQ